MLLNVIKKCYYPALVNTVFQKLAKILFFYINKESILQNITIDKECEDLSEQSGLMLWKHLTDKNAGESNNRDQTDSDDDKLRKEN